MLDKEFQKTKHLNNRAVFGLSPGAKQSVNTFFEKREIIPIEVISKPGLSEVGMSADRNAQQKIIQAKSHDDTRKLNIAWMGRLRTTPDSFREKMVLFWHNHFACRSQRVFLAQQQNNLFRKHALGSFADLLMEVSKDPAMLQFLNNQQNRKGHPNENFAREVMELFTLGRGNYTETDIKEAARAFTGWKANKEGEFIFQTKEHDPDVKTFRGQSGNFSGEDIINRILEDKQTARFIARKLTAYLVSPLVEDKYIEDLAQSFYKSGYNIERLLRDIFSADWFFEKKFVGTHVKSPVELLIGMQQQTDSKFIDDQALIFFQRGLNQLLFFPPNVGGWPSGKDWIDSSSLAFRMVISQKIFNKQDIGFRPKDDGDVNSLREKKRKLDLSLDVNWENLATRFSGNQAQVYEKAEDFLLSNPTSPQNKELILKFSNKAKNETDLVKAIFTGIMSLPEYQLC